MNDLTEMMAKADAIHARCASLTITTPIKKLTSDALELQGYIHRLQTVAQRMAAISNFITRLIHRKNPLAIKMINLTPDPGDYVRLATQAMQAMHCLPCCVPCVPVDNLADIYVTYLYQYQGLYVININGHIIHGQPGRIGYGLPHSLVCKAAICRPECQFAHQARDPPDLRDLTVTPRNYTPNAWVTTSAKAAAGNQRLTGSIDTLAGDVADLSDDELEAEINLRKSQLIHDICIYQALLNMRYKRKAY